MRSTRASNAIARLQSRSGKPGYALQIHANGGFTLLENLPDGNQQALSGVLELDEFVRFVEAFGPQKPKKISKLDIAFEQQLKQT